MDACKGIYKFWYSDLVTVDKSLVGKEVKVVKGRKYPIGTTARIEGFYRYNVNKWTHTDYVVTDVGKIDIRNVVLVKPIVNYEEKSVWVGRGGSCPNCGCHKSTFEYGYYDRASDYNVDVYRCNKCELRLSRI